MQEIAITAETLLKALAILATIGGGTAIITRWLSPWRTLKKTVEQHTRLLDNDHKQFQALGKERAEDRAISRAQSLAILALLDHGITNNSVDKLKRAKERLQEQLVEH